MIFTASYLSTISMHTLSSHRYDSLRLDPKPTVMATRSVEEFINDAEKLFNDNLDLPSLMSLSDGLQEQFKQRLQASEICMLPSFNHTLPSGDESGSYLAVDVGGSNLRVSLVDLAGDRCGNGAMKIVKLLVFPITSEVRSLKGPEFFDWMAEKIEQITVCQEVEQTVGHGPYIMGVAWSFPVK
jgi:hexokinase